MTDKTFPLVDPENLWLSCFNCYQDLYSFEAVPSGNATGRGAFYACCESCGMKTFFDFTGESHAAHADKR